MPPSVPVPNSAGAQNPDNAGFWAGAPAGKPGGEIVLSKAEAAALTAFETEDPKQAMLRAEKESGLTQEQLSRLKARAERARKAGYALKGGTITLRPLNHSPEEPTEGSLVRHDKDDKTRAETAKSARAKSAKPTASIKPR